ncbi:hypothetical protein Dimus_018625 [Dionaea muscipula]
MAIATTATRLIGSTRRRASSVKYLLLMITILTVTGVTLLTLRQVEPLIDTTFPIRRGELDDSSSAVSGHFHHPNSSAAAPSCATVEEMGQAFVGEGSWKESLRVRKLIQNHFEINGATRVRSLPAIHFCRHGFVLGKASEAGFGNEMYKLLTAAALSVMLNRSLIIGQTRHIKHSFTLKEVKHLWRENSCASKYGRNLVVRVDDFQKPSDTNVLCSNWKEWEHPVIWFQNTTDAVAAQFFLKNIHPDMRNAAYELFGKPEVLHSRPNVFGELMKVLVFPSQSIEEAVMSVLPTGADPDISVHMRMLMNRLDNLVVFRSPNLESGIIGTQLDSINGKSHETSSSFMLGGSMKWKDIFSNSKQFNVRSAQAALSCMKKALQKLHQVPRTRVVLISDTPSFLETMKSSIDEFAEVLHFDYELFRGNISSKSQESRILGFRVKDWGPTPRWVAFVDFFLASRAKHAVISGAHRRVGTTYAQLIASLAAARNLDENSSAALDFSFFSSFGSNLLTRGLGNQIGWGHVWNRFSGPLSCHEQTTQCAFTPLLPPAWWDGIWQSPIPRDIRRLEAYGVRLSSLGTIDDDHLQSFCKSRKTKVIQVSVTAM